MEVEHLKEVLKNHGYIFCDFLGSGAFAQCYVIQDFRYSHKFACKVISLRDCDKTIKAVVQKYHIEVESLCSVCHPNVIKIYNYFYEESFLFVIVEYCSNGTLEDFIKSSGILTGQRLFSMITQFASALAICHANEVAHRDLKPANLLMDADYNLKICDFGLACIHEPISQKYCGNMKYAAPEVKHKKPYDPYKADVWSFGLCIAYMSMEPEDYDKWHEFLEYGNCNIPNYVPSFLVKVIRHSTFLDPGQRWSMSEIVNYLHSHVKQPSKSQRSSMRIFRGSSLIKQLTQPRFVGSLNRTTASILPKL